MTQAPTGQPIAETHKQRCPTDNSTLFYFTKQGLSLRCRHCKGVVVIPWEELVQKYQELRKEQNA